MNVVSSPMPIFLQLRRPDRSRHLQRRSGQFPCDRVSAGGQSRSSLDFHRATMLPGDMISLSLPSAWVRSAAVCHRLSRIVGETLINERSACVEISDSSKIVPACPSCLIRTGPVGCTGQKQHEQMMRHQLDADLDGGIVTVLPGQIPGTNLTFGMQAERFCGRNGVSGFLRFNMQARRTT
jgi:hypothetical protein